MSEQKQTREVEGVLAPSQLMIARPGAAWFAVPGVAEPRPAGARAFVAPALRLPPALSPPPSGSAPAPVGLIFPVDDGERAPWVDADDDLPPYAAAAATLASLVDALPADAHLGDRAGIVVAGKAFDIWSLSPVLAAAVLGPSLAAGAVFLRGDTRLRLRFTPESRGAACPAGTGEAGSAIAVVLAPGDGLLVGDAESGEAVALARAVAAAPDGGALCWADASWTVAEVAEIARRAPVRTAWVEGALPWVRAESSAVRWFDWLGSLLQDGPSRTVAGGPAALQRAWDDWRKDNTGPRVSLLAGAAFDALAPTLDGLAATLRALAAAGVVPSPGRPLPYGLVPGFDESPRTTLRRAEDAMARAEGLLSLGGVDIDTGRRTEQLVEALRPFVASAPDGAGEGEGAAL